MRRETSTGIVGGIIGIATLVLTASGVFGEMEDALNAIWRAPPKGALLPRLLRGRARSLGLVMGLGVLLVISMLIGGAISAFQHTIAVETALSRATLAVLHGAVSYLLAAVLFAAIYKTLPNKDLEWRDVIAGALGTALLFLFGQILLGWFLGSSMIARPYGAAGGMILLLLWVYYSAQVFLLGAEFTKVYASHFGSPGLRRARMGRRISVPNAPPLRPDLRRRSSRSTCCRSCCRCSRCRSWNAS